MNKLSHPQTTVTHCMCRAFINPFSIILFVLAAVSLITDVLLPEKYGQNYSSVIIICVMLLLGGMVRLIQELRAKRVADRLARMTQTTISVCRDGIWQEVSSEELVVGDLVRVEAGDRIPADIELTEARNLFVSQSVITGESESLEKKAQEPQGKPEKLSEYVNVVFQGTTVTGGYGIGVVCAVGANTVYGGLDLERLDQKRGFDSGSGSIAWVLIRFMVILVPMVFLASGLTQGNWVEAFLFALSVAVGLTPEMLPMVVSACLAKGSYQMGKEQTVVKNINAMQTLGSMDVLCVDKTGTLTNDTILLEYYMDILGNESRMVLDYAFLNSHYHSGVKNHLDTAVLKYGNMPGMEDHFAELLRNSVLLDEQPFDYDHKYVGVLLKGEAENLHIIKGSVENVVSKCRYAEFRGERVAVTADTLESVHAVTDELTEDGMKVLAVAYRKTSASSLDAAPEREDSGFTLIGYLAFFDAPKKSAAETIKSLREQNVDGEEDSRVLRHAYLNSYFQTGYKNLMDLAIIQKTEEEERENPQLTDLSEHYTKVDEIPFDFTRRRLTTVVQDRSGKTQMITKGAVEEMLSVCSFAEIDGEVKPLCEEVRGRILQTADELNEKGFRVLCIAHKTNPSSVGVFSVKDEADMVLIGYLAFLDPPKESTADAIRALAEHGVHTKILTGDNDKVTRTICAQVGLKVRNMLLGSDLEYMSDEELAKAAETTDVFAKLAPDQKSRIVSVLRKNGHTVGFMGDGINDAAAMKAADIGISVDTAVDIAKESADIILLEKDLMVLEEGIIEGRKTYANMIKYIKMTASSNFGNMFSVLAASALLPFLPMMSVHLIFLNLIYDLSCTAIPWDNVDEEFIAVPRKWDASSVGSFMIWIGPTSSVFDIVTYIFMYFVFCPMFVSGGVLYNDLAAHFGGAELADMQFRYMAMFQAGWFVESMWSQTLVIHMIRTPKLPFIQSHASAPLTLMTMTGIAVLTIIPFTPLGTMLGFVALPASYFLFLIPCILLYMLLATCLKKAYVRHYGELL